MMRYDPRRNGRSIASRLLSQDHNTRQILHILHTVDIVDLHLSAPSFLPIRTWNRQRCQLSLYTNY